MGDTIKGVSKGGLQAGKSLKRLIVATENSHKFQEIKSIIDLDFIELVPGSAIQDPPDCEETGETYLDNALIKARAYFRCSGLPALADDSGLEVDALNGSPGLRSRRFFGPELTDAARIEKLLALLQKFPACDRTARFRCTAVIFWKDQIAVQTEGLLEGRIAFEPSGSGGFGYDPVFFVPEYGKTVAEMGLELKNRISHRGLAMAGIRRFLLDHDESFSCCKSLKSCAKFPSLRGQSARRGT